MTSPLRDTEINWKVADEYGLSHLHLNCLQSSCKEIFKRRDKQDLIESFLHPLDCILEGNSVRNVPPMTMNRGLQFRELEIQTSDGMEPIRSLLETHGHCFMKFNGMDAPFSMFYERMDVQHWAMIFDVEGDTLYVMDDSGNPQYFEGVKGRIPLSLAQQALEDGVIYRLAVAVQEEPPVAWGVEFTELMRTSVENMCEHGFANLEQFCERIAKLDLERADALQNELDYVVYFFRKPRELLKLAFERHAVPDFYWQREEIYSALDQVCKAWSITSGYVLKWGFLKKKDFRPKIQEQVKQALAFEREFVAMLAKAVADWEERVMV